MTIRFAILEDLEAIIELCKEHAEFEKAEYNKIGKTEKLRNTLFAKSPKFRCLLAEIDDEIVGFATYMKQFSTWDAEDYIYLDCLFLRESARSKKIGTHLMLKIKEEAQKLGCKQIQWQTPKFNRKAIKFYEGLGAISKSKERFLLTLKKSND